MSDTHWSDRYRPGDWVRHLGHGGLVFEYTLVNREHTMSAKGEPKLLLTWRGRCAVCAEAFEFQARGHRHRLLRTCEAHRNAWVPPVPRKRRTPRRPKKEQQAAS